AREYVHGPARDLAVGAEPPRREVHHRAGRLPVRERDAHDLVAGRHRPVPRTVVRHEQAPAVLRRELLAGVEGHAERGGVGLDLDGGERDLLAAVLRPRLPGADLLPPPEARGPAVEAALLPP